MAKSSGGIIEDLTNAAHSQRPVRVRRDHDWWADDLCGFVVGVGEHWLVIQRLIDAVYIDGYDVVRIKDVTAVEDDREGGYIERGVAALGRPEVDLRLPVGAETSEVLRATADHAALVGVHLEREADYPLLFGHIVRLGEKKFDMQLINPRGIWTVDPTRWRYKDVTRVTSGDRYAAGLAEFGEQRPLG